MSRHYLVQLYCTAIPLPQSAADVCAGELIELQHLGPRLPYRGRALADDAVHFEEDCRCSDRRLCLRKSAVVAAVARPVAATSILLTIPA